jgi:hypothetical protein
MTAESRAAVAISLIREAGCLPLSGTASLIGCHDCQKGDRVPNRVCEKNPDSLDVGKLSSHPAGWGNRAKKLGIGEAIGAVTDRGLIGMPLGDFSNDQ